MRGGLGSARDPTAMLLGRSETRARLPRPKKQEWICFFMFFIVCSYISLNLGACGALHALIKLEHLGAKVTKSRLFCRVAILRIAFLELFRNVPLLSGCSRIRQVDPFNTTWVPHTPGMQPFPTQSSQLDLQLFCCL